MTALDPMLTMDLRVLVIILHYYFFPLCSQHGGGTQGHSYAIKQALQLGVGVNHKKSILLTTQNIEYFGLKSTLFHFGLFVTRTSGKISPAPWSVSPGNFSLVTSLPPHGRARGLSDFCGSSWPVNDEGFPMLGTLPLSGLMSSQPR